MDGPSCELRDNYSNNHSNCKNIVRDKIVNENGELDIGISYVLEWQESVDQGTGMEERISTPLVTKSVTTGCVRVYLSFFSQ